MKFWIAFLLYSFMVLQVNAGGIVRFCSEPPSEEKPCDMYSSLSYMYLDSVNVVENGKLVKKTETTLYISLQNDEPFGDAGVVIFEIYEVLDAITMEYRFIEQRRLEVEPDWNYSWIKFTFNEKGHYKIRCFVGDTWAAESSIPIWLRD